MIAAPAAGQSICFDGVSFYLDKTTTIGLPNDTTNACGTIKGRVNDAEGAPIESVLVLCGLSWNPAVTFTDSKGEFSICSIASRTRLALQRRNFVSWDTTFQVWPESTQSLSAVLKTVVSVPRSSANETIMDFSLGDPFPNPFNPETSFDYSLPVESNVELSVYTIRGQLVDLIFSGRQNRGRYHATWNAARFPSGIYFFRLLTPQFKQTRKCLLVR